MGIEVKQSPGAGLLHCRTMIIEIRMQYLNYSKGRFEQRRRLVQRVQQLLFVGLCQKRNNQNLVLLGPAVGVRFECLQQSEVASQILLLSVLLNYLFKFANSLNDYKVTTSLVSGD